MPTGHFVLIFGHLKAFLRSLFKMNCAEQASYDFVLTCYWQRAPITGQNQTLRNP